jgi:hypothetical protein
LTKQGYLLSIKGQFFEWHLNWKSFYDARLDSIVARTSDEEINMAKRGTKQKLWIATMRKVLM